ncbi:hypothetical protein GOODEAATRI_033257, partial [Goodea atripinnis]
MDFMKAKLEAADSDIRRYLEQEISGLGRQIAGYQTESHSAAASLSLKIETLEKQNAKELSSIQAMPAPTPCPETSMAPIYNQLTPELQQAMERWFTDRIKGYPVLLPGKCWAFHGVQGTLVISLSHPISITHVTLDHLPRYNSPTGHINSAPKDFEVYGLKNDTEEGTLLGTFTYDENGESTQTFKLP